MHYFYLPLDRNSKQNLGYAYIDCKNYAVCQRVEAALHRKRLSKYFTHKNMVVEPSRLQGIDNILHDLLSRNNLYQNEHWCPLSFNSKGEWVFLYGDSIKKEYERRLLENSGQQGSQDAGADQCAQTQ